MKKKESEIMKFKNVIDAMKNQIFGFEQKFQKLLSTVVDEITPYGDLYLEVSKPRYSLTATMVDQVTEVNHFDGTQNVVDVKYKDFILEDPSLLETANIMIDNYEYLMEKIDMKISRIKEQQEEDYIPF